MLVIVHDRIVISMAQHKHRLLSRERQAYLQEAAYTMAAMWAGHIGLPDGWDEMPIQDWDYRYRQRIANLLGCDQRDLVDEPDLH